MSRIVTFGEIMLRLMPEDGHRLLQNDRLEATFGGGEANVAVSLANFGLNAAYVTALPENAVGQAAINAMRYFGVDTSMILRQGDRMGVYFVEKGQSQRPSKVLYDRKYSAISMAARSDFDWDAIFEGAAWFHFTGITPALSDELKGACLDACRAAKARGITISCDLNYRKNLWSREKAGQVMGELVPYVDVLIANEEDSADVFGIHAEHTDINSGKLDVEGYKSVARQLVERFHCEKVAITLRESLSASDNNWSGMLYDGATGEISISKKYAIRIVDRVGGGDSFGSGLIYALLSGYDNQGAVEYAAAASALKHTIEGDFNMVSVAEVKSLMGGNASGRVQR